jgi:hypothetical protein
MNEAKLNWCIRILYDKRFKAKMVFTNNWLHTLINHDLKKQYAKEDREFLAKAKEKVEFT